MKYMIIQAFIAILVATGSAAGQGSKSPCSSIKDDAGRLACYDSGGKVVPDKPKTSTTIKAAQPDELLAKSARNEFRSRLEKTFLSNGVSAELYIDMDKDVRHPELTIWTYLSRASVYQLITAGDILSQAKRLGFATVDFWDKGSEGHWFYDLYKSESIPSCDRMRRLCI